MPLLAWRATEPDVWSLDFESLRGALGSGSPTQPNPWSERIEIPMNTRGTDILCLRSCFSFLLICDSCLLLYWSRPASCPAEALQSKAPHRILTPSSMQPRPLL